MYYLGIDHHKRYSQVAVVDEKGTVRTNGKIANEKKAFTLLKEYYKELTCPPKTGPCIMLDYHSTVLG